MSAWNLWRQLLLATLFFGGYFTRVAKAESKSGFDDPGLGQLNLFSSPINFDFASNPCGSRLSQIQLYPHWGWSARGSKRYQLSIGWYRLGYLWVGPAYILSKACKSEIQSCTSGVKNTSKKAHEREIKWNPMWNWWPLFIWTWIMGYRFWGVPYLLCRFRDPLQLSRQLLTTL